jgi:hypothetical protein
MSEGSYFGNGLPLVSGKNGATKKARAIMGGLAVATALTLVFLPSLYVAWFRIKEPSPLKVDCIDLSDQFHQTSKN